jgi:hypothetical protein
MVELGLGATALVLFAARPEETSIYAVWFGLQATLFTVYTVYSAILVRTRPGVPCACSAGDEPATMWVSMRALLLAGAAAATAAVTSPTVVHITGEEAATALLVGAALLPIVWLLPRALLEPRHLVMAALTEVKT